jgi:hypothetical protein
VSAKKTQRDKDWPMIRRLVEADYYHVAKPIRAQVAWWLRELRTSDLLIDLSRRYRRVARRPVADRPALRPALEGDRAGVERALRAEELRYRAKDRRHWTPLRAELALWRRRQAE